jgi:ribose transport system permease protein
MVIFVPSFATSNNFINIAKQVTINGIISLGLTFIILSGNLDLSVGSQFSLYGVLAISLQPKGLFIAILVPILVAIAVGFINGYLISKFEINSMIFTLGMLSVIGAVAMIYTNGYNQLGDPESPYSFISKGFLFEIPSYVFFFIALTIILHFILSRSSLGRNIYLMGTNREAAKIVGIKVTNITILGFIITSLCVVLASIILSSRLSSASAIAGVGYEFNAITAVLIGGNSLFGGKGSIYNTFLGVLLLGIIINGMILLNLPFGLQSVIKGSLLILAVYADLRTRGRLVERSS